MNNRTNTNKHNNNKAKTIENQKKNNNTYHIYNLR